jgi:hypothetical protein
VHEVVVSTPDLAPGLASTSTPAPRSCHVTRTPLSTQFVGGEGDTEWNNGVENEEENSGVENHGENNGGEEQNDGSEHSISRTANNNVSNSLLPVAATGNDRAG